MIHSPCLSCAIRRPAVQGRPDRSQLGDGVRLRLPDKTQTVQAPAGGIVWKEKKPKIPDADRCRGASCNLYWLPVNGGSLVFSERAGEWKESQRRRRV